MQLVKSRVQQQKDSIREHNYGRLRELVIAAMREREGALHIDYTAATDIAWHIAEKLPCNMRIERVPVQSVKEMIEQGRDSGATRLQIREIEFKNPPADASGCGTVLGLTFLILLIFSTSWIL